MKRSRSEHKPSSHLAERLELLVEKWVERLAPPFQREFRDDFERFGHEHDQMLDILESIWNRRQHDYAFDESTGLARRRPFQDYLVRMLSHQPVGGAVAVLFIDLDNLKQINDRCGHAAGDQAVAAIGAIIRETIRQDRPSDVVVKVESPERDPSYSASRHGGDEFLVALELRHVDDIDAIAPRLKLHVDDGERQRAHGYRASVRLTSSVGAVVYERPARVATVAANMLATALVTAADAQMYLSKRDGLVHVAVATFTSQLEVGGERVLRAG